MSDNNKNAMTLDRRKALGALAIGAGTYTILGAGAAAAQVPIATVHEGEKLEDFASVAPFKVLWLIKRNPAISVEEFRQAYLKHAQEIAHQLGHTLYYYRLTFIDEQHLGMRETPPGVTRSYTGPEVPVEYDCVTEMSGDFIVRDAIREPHPGSPEAFASQLEEQEFIDYASVVSLYGQEYIFAS